NRSNWDPDVDIKRSFLWPDSGRCTAIWKCPAEHSSVIVDGERKPRVRSMSMNLWVGGFLGTDEGLSDGYLDANWQPIPGGSTWRVYQKMTEMNDPGPSRT